MSTDPLDTDPATGNAVPLRYRVRLKCPTPLRDHELLVGANSEAEAWSKFCRHNSITDSDHPRTIERV